MSDTGTRPADRARVELRVPADSAFASVLRTTAAGLAARQDFTLDDIEDLRMAVAEATALVLEQADPDAELVAGFELSPGRLTVTVAADAAAAVPDLDSFAWQVLTTLADSAETDASDGHFAVTLTMESSATGAGR